VIRCTGARRLVQDAGAAASLNVQPNSVPVPLALRNSGRQDSTITGTRWRLLRSHGRDPGSCHRRRAVTGCGL